MPNRIIKESLCTSEKVSSLTDFEFRLWVGLITQADDLGRGDARAAIIKGRVFPLRDRVTVKDIDSAIHGLAAKGCISLYKVGGKSYFWFPTWGEHQRIRDCKPKFPGPEDADEENNPPQHAATCGDLRPESNPIQSESQSESKGEKRPRGAHKIIRLTDVEYSRLVSDFGQTEVDRVIAYVDEYAQMNGKRYKDWNLALRKASREGWGLKQPAKGNQPGQDVGASKERIRKNGDWLDEFLASQEAANEV